MIDYKSLLNDAMLSVVKKALTDIQKSGLTEDQSLYISFHTNYPEVVLSKSIKEKYPQEITIVLQHQFDSLVVSKGAFSVSLAFGGMPETIVVPFKSLTNFVDPNANFSIQFYDMEDVENIENHNTSHFNKADVENITTLRHHINADPNSINTMTQNIQSTTNKPGNVIMLDKFRKNNKKQ